MTDPIPFNRTQLVGRELEYVEQAMRSGRTGGGRDFSTRCQHLLERELGVPKVLLTASCTHALEMSCILLGIGPGDEVVVPSYTFVSTVNAFVLHGAKPVFCDVRPDTLNLDERRLEALITPKTKAIVAVHYAGVACEMREVLAIAARHGVAVVEDNAHGLFGKYRGEWLGTWGALATQSFHETKNITCGEGGALVINDPGLEERAKVIRDMGTDRSRFFEGKVDKYTWVDVGSSYRLGDVLAAYLLGQLESWRTIQEDRRRTWELYHEHLDEWAEATGVGLPYVPAHCEQTHHMYYLLPPTPEARRSLIGHLATLGISAVFHYQPLHLSAMGRKLGGRPGDCPVSEDISDRLLRLPFYTGLPESAVERVVAGLKSWNG